MNSDPSRSLRIDNRFVLGAVIAALAWFVGTTFTTESACLSYVVAAVLGGILGEKWSQVWPRHPVAPQDASGLPHATGLPNATALPNATGLPHGDRARLWGVMWRALLLLLVMIGALVLIFLWRISDRVTESSSMLLLAVDTIAHYGIALICILWAVWPRQGHVTMMVIALVTVLMTVASGGVSNSRTAQTAVGLVTVIGFVVAAQVIVSRHRFASITSDERRSNFRSEAWPYLLLTLSLILIVVSTLVQVTDSVLPNVQAEVFAQLKGRFENADSPVSWAGGGYVMGGRLGSVRQRILSDPTGIALRGYCDSIPGYLRGNVYDSYTERRWRSRRRWVERDSNGAIIDMRRSRPVRALGGASVKLQRPSNQSRSRFSLNVNSVAPVNRIFAGTVEIHGHAEKGPQAFLPAAAMWVEGQGETIGVTPDGLINEGLNTAQPWVAGVAMSTETEELTADARELLSSVSPSILDQVAEIADEVCLGAISPSQKAQRIASYFQANFFYSLTPTMPPRGIDPIVHFLDTKHPGHCELFASASTLMMRTQGIPARYVTGYVMDEFDQSQSVYLARNRDAHAWVEYYDENQQRWLSLESTPGHEYRTLNVVHPDLSADVEANSPDGKPLAALGWLREQLGKLLSLRVTDALAAIFRVLQLPVLIGLVLWLWWRKRGDRSDARATALVAARRAMDRRLRRRGWTRRASETLHQFADRLESASCELGSEKELQQQAEFAQAAQWYRDHAIALYRQGPTVAKT